MKKILFLFLITSFGSLSAQEKAPQYWFKKWRFGMSYQIEVGDAFKGSDQSNIIATESTHKIDAHLNHKVNTFVELRLTPNFSFRTGLTFGTSGLSYLVSGDAPFNVGITEVAFVHRSRFSTFEIPALFYFSKDWNRQNYYWGTGVAISGIFNYNGETLQIGGPAGFCCFFRDSKPSQNYALILTGGYSFQPGKNFQLFMEPYFRVNLSKTTTDIIDNHFFAFGLTLGAHMKFER